MSKKPTGGAPPDAASPLTHSPFAALRGAVAATPAPSRAPAPSAQKRVEARGSARERGTDASKDTTAQPLPERSTAAAGALAQPQPTAPGSGKSKSIGRVVLRRETKHRGGKAVVIVTGLGALPSFDEAAIAALAQRLKKQLGCGGTVESEGGDRQIVLQGDRAAQVAGLLRGLGFRVDGVTK